MIIDNKLTSTKATLFYWILIFLSITFFVWAFWNRLNQNWISFGLGILTTLVYLSFLATQPNYFSYNDREDKLLFRFYNAHPFFMKPKTVQIHKKLLTKYEIQESLGGLQKKLILHQKTPKGIAKYPPISISALGPQQIKKLKRALAEQVAYAARFKK